VARGHLNIVEGETRGLADGLSPHVMPQRVQIHAHDAEEERIIELAKSITHDRDPERLIILTGELERLVTLKLVWSVRKASENRREAA